ncbi:MAG: integrase, partial [Nitrososphaeraceae archaeon]
YISLDNLQPIRLLDHFPHTWNAIRLACKRRGLNMEMSLTRKLFASHLRQEGIQPEVVDMLQGRVSQSVLTRHYLVPQSSLKDQVLGSMEKLKQAIEQK